MFPYLDQIRTNLNQYIVVWFKQRILKKPTRETEPTHTSVRTQLGIIGLYLVIFLAQSQSLIHQKPQPGLVTTKTVPAEPKPVCIWKNTRIHLDPLHLNKTQKLGFEFQLYVVFSLFSSLFVLSTRVSNPR